MTAKKKRIKKETAGQAVVKDKQAFDWLHQIAFWGLALLLFFPPYFRGLFFAPEQEKALIFATLVFWLTFLWRWLQNDRKFLRGPLDYFALALPVIYIISAFTAVNKELAIDEVVKNILYFLTYWSVSRLVRNKEDIHKLLHVIYISAIGVALAGLATAAGIIHINDGFNVSDIGGFISSTFQYHNALAVYLGAVFFAGLYLWHLSNDRRRPVLSKTANAKGISQLELFWAKNSGFFYVSGNFLLLALLLGSKSRAGILVFGVVLVLYLIAAGNERCLSASLISGYLGITAYVVMSRFIPLVQDKQYGTAWLWVGGGVVLALTGQLVFTLIDRYVFSRWMDDGKKFILAFASLAAIVIVAGGIFIAGKPQVVAKVTNAEYLHNAYQRFYYMDCAREMISEHPLLGWGGGGWKEAYEAYLTYRYTTREVHSYYFQVGVETGIPGVGIVLGIWLAFMYSSYLLLRKSVDRDTRRLVWLLVMIFLMISGHALIDFDLSLSAITLVLWSVFGIVSALPRLGGVEKERRKKQTGPGVKFVPLVAVTAVSLVIFLMSACLLDAANKYDQGMYRLGTNNVNGGLESLEKAVAYNPFSAKYRIILSQVYNGLGKNNAALVEARKAVDLSPYGFAARTNLAKIAAAGGDHDLAVAEIENTVSLAPNNIETYEEYAQDYVNLGVRELTTGKSDAAREHLGRAAGVAGMIDRQVASLSDRDLEMWQGPALTLTDKIRLALGQAAYFQGSFSEAREYLSRASNSKMQDVKGRALVWLALLYEKDGRAEQPKKFLDEADKLIPEYAQQYEAFKEIPVL